MREPQNSEALSLADPWKEDEEDLTHLLISAHDMGDLDIPPREYAIEPWMPLSGLAMVHAARGVGKTWFGMYVAGCVAMGTPCFSYPVPKGRKAWIVDGELPLVVLKERCNMLWGEKPENLWFLSSERLSQSKVRLNLNSKEWQGWFFRLLDQAQAKGKCPELIVFDNRSTLLFGREANNNDHVDAILDFDLQLRFRGLAVLWIEHEGKVEGKGSRGASRAEDPMDYILGLKGEPEGFSVTFTKTRGIEPVPNTVLVRLEPYSERDLHGGLRHRLRLTEQAAGTGGIPTYMRTLICLHGKTPKTQKELGAILGMSSQAAGKRVKDLRERGLVQSDNYSLSPKGLAVVSKYPSSGEIK